MSTKILYKRIPRIKAMPFPLREIDLRGVGHEV